MPLPPVHPEEGYDVHPWVARMNDIENSDEELGSDARRREAIAAMTLSFIREAAAYPRSLRRARSRQTTISPDPTIRAAPSQV